MASLSTWEFVNLGQVVFQGQLNQLFLYWSLTGTWGVGGGGTVPLSQSTSGQLKSPQMIQSLLLSLSCCSDASSWSECLCSRWGI